MFARPVLSILAALFALLACLVVVLMGSVGETREEFPRTLRDLQLGDDGAYVCTTMPDRDSLRLLLVGPDGKARFDATLDSEGGYVDGASFPYSIGVVVDRDGDRVVFRIEHLDEHETFEEWRVVRWSTGDLISSVRLAPPLDRSQAYCNLHAVKPIAGTPLLACYWTEISLKDSPRGAAQGARVVVTNIDAEPVWEFDAPHDYEVTGNSDRADRLLRWARGSDAVLTCSAPNQFEIVLAAVSQRITFEVTAAASTKNGWIVRELARESCTIEFDEPHRRPPHHIADH